MDHFYSLPERADSGVVDVTLANRPTTKKHRAHRGHQKFNGLQIRFRIYLQQFVQVAIIIITCFQHVVFREKITCSFHSPRLIATVHPIPLLSSLNPSHYLPLNITIPSPWCCTPINGPKHIQICQKPLLNHGFIYRKILKVWGERDYITLGFQVGSIDFGCQSLPGVDTSTSSTGTPIWRASRSSRAGGPWWRCWLKPSVQACHNYCTVLLIHHFWSIPRFYIVLLVNGNGG